ncbi:hypothetical protein [Plantactinospora sp. CA-290183]|uniref:hypothetical protein n=1 Tax=Plantactinospora sp. CA-290183 TaxID=3240006 RepID=UPI003D934B94
MACLGWNPGQREELQSLLFATLRSPEVTDYLQREIRSGHPLRKVEHESVQRTSQEVPTGRSGSTSWVVVGVAMA